MYISYIIHRYSMYVTCLYLKTFQHTVLILHISLAISTSLFLKCYMQNPLKNYRIKYSMYLIILLTVPAKSLD